MLKIGRGLKGLDCKYANMDDVENPHSGFMFISTLKQTFLGLSTIVFRKLDKNRTFAPVYVKENCGSRRTKEKSNVTFSWDSWCECVIKYQEIHPQSHLPFR